jgi:hypothetical protein
MIGEVSHISQHGIWLLLRDRELFISYDDFPWFKDATVLAVLNVKLLSHTISTGRISISISRAYRSSSRHGFR